MGSGISGADILRGLRETGPAKTAALMARADAVRKRHAGDAVQLRGIIEFSNFCRRDCLYCGLRKSNRALRRYRMAPREMIAAARTAKALKIPTVVLQSGEDPGFPLSELCGVVMAIHKMGLAVTLGVGELPERDYRKLKAAGADRYLLKIETTDRRLYERLRPGCRLRDRIACLKTLRKLGFQVGSGSMVGLPGQSLQSISRDILLFKRLDLDMIGIGPFIPHPQTPLAGRGGAGMDLVLKAVALARLVVPDAHIPATTATEVIDPRGREKALVCGANVVMPNVTPAKYRRYYQIYPGKVRAARDARLCVPRLARRIRSLGRSIAVGRGDALK